MEFITHAYAYQVFREKPYEAYKLFQFPQYFFDHVETQRNVLRQRLESLLVSANKKEAKKIGNKREIKRIKNGSV